MKRIVFSFFVLVFFTAYTKAQIVTITNPGVLQGPYERLIDDLPDTIRISSISAGFLIIGGTSGTSILGPGWQLFNQWQYFSPAQNSFISVGQLGARMSQAAYNKVGQDLDKLDFVKVGGNYGTVTGMFRTKLSVNNNSNQHDEKYSQPVYFGFYKTRNFSLTFNTTNPNQIFVRWGVGSFYPELVKYISQSEIKYIPINKSAIQIRYSPSDPWETFLGESITGAASITNRMNNLIKNNPFAPHDIRFRGYIVPKGDSSGAIFYTPETIYHHQPGKKIVLSKNGTGFDALPFTVATANPGDTIEFGGTVNNGDTIFLNDPLSIDKHLYIRGYKNGNPIRITVVAPGKTAFFVERNQKLRLENLTVSNSAKAVKNDVGGGLELLNCTFANNSNTGVESNGNSLSIINCTISGNGNLTNNGNGVIIFGNTTPAIIQSSTIINNMAKDFGGGLGIFASWSAGAFLKNNIIANNKIGTSSGEKKSDINNTGNFTWPAGNVNPYQSGGHNIFGSGKWYFNSAVTDIVGSSDNPIDPQLGPLAANGVTNRPFTHALNGCGSPAVNAGSNDGALVLDQRGLGVSGGQRDIGAFELQATDPSSNQPGVKYVTNGAADGVGSLKYTMEHLNCADTIRFRPANGIGFTIFLNGIITPNNNVVVDAENYKITISGKNQPAGLNRILEVGNRSVFLQNLTLADVNRTGSSGVFSILSGGQLTLQGCLIKNNKVTQRGAVAYLISGATLNINNCTISGNEATEMGGVVYVDGGTLRIENSTLAFNKTTSTNSSFGGGAMAVSSVAGAANISIFNSIIAKNTSASNGQDIKQALNRINASAGSHTIFGILEPGVSGTITMRTGDVSGTLASPLDPQLQLLQFNGGPTQTHAIGCGSMAYQTGLFNNTPANNIGSAMVDQRQLARVLPHDKGAFEIGQGNANSMAFHNYMITDTSVINSGTNSNRYKHGSLADALLNICEDGIIIADDSSSTYNTSGVLINTQYRQYTYLLNPNEPIEITKNVTIDFNHAKITRGNDPFTGLNGTNLFRVNPGKTLTIKNAWFTPSVPNTGNLGGFAFVMPTGKIRFENCRISGMKADTGAVVYGGKIEAITSQFDNDSATIGNVFYSNDSVILKGCTITENNRVGHVIFMNGSNAKLVIANNVIGDTGTVTATNARDIQRINGATIISSGYNLVSNTATPSWGLSGDYDGAFTKNQANLEGVSSVTKGTVFRPACNSLALGSGNPGSYGLLTDINGNQRFNDRGAFERGTVRYVTNTDTSVFTVGSLPYVVANTCDSIIFDASLEGESIAVSGLHLTKPVAGLSGSGQNLWVKSAVRINLIGNTPTRNEPVFYVDSVDNLNVTIDGLTFSANGGTAEGAAINSRSFGGTTTIKNCTFTGNTSTNPLAMVISGRNTTIERSTIAFNTGAGAPVYSRGQLLVRGSTIARNTATGPTGGVAVDGTINHVINSIVAKNQFGSGGADIRRISGTLNGFYNFVGVYNPAVGFSSSTGDTLGSAAAPIDPRLDTALGINQGVNTLTLALTDSSGCINRGDPAFFSNDQRNFPVINGRIDIGAYEINPVCSGYDSAFTDRIGPNNARLNFYGGNSSNSIIEYRPVDSTNWLFAATVFSVSNTHQYSLGGLQPGVNYVWRIKSYCWGGRDSASSYLERYFTTQCSLPDSVWVSAQDTTSLGFTWTNMPGNSGYIVQLKNLSDTLAPVLSITKAANDTTHLFTNIGYADEFEFKLFTRCGTDTTDYRLLFANTDTIPYVKVIAPDAPALYADCSQRTIYWESYKAGNNYKIEVSYNNGNSYTTLNANYQVVNNLKEYQISLPVGNYDSCFVRVSSVALPALIDVNDTAFKINNLLPIPHYSDSAFNMCKGSTQQLVITLDTLHFPWYSWTLPFGYTGSSDSSKIFITAPNFDTSGVIQVFARTGCDSSLVLSIPTTTKVTNVWTGVTSIQWNTASNWSCNFVPGITDNVEIPAGVPNMPTIPAGLNAEIGNMTIKPGASVTILNTAILNVKQNLRLEGNALLDAQPGSNVTVRTN